MLHNYYIKLYNGKKYYDTEKNWKQFTVDHNLTSLSEEGVGIIMNSITLFHRSSNEDEKIFTSRLNGKKISAKISIVYCWIKYGFVYVFL